MPFLHRESTGVIQELTIVGEKSSYVAGASLIGHLKPYSLEDSTFDVSGLTGSLHKFTTKGDITISEADQIIINTVTYNVKAVKKYSGINFTTTKILLSTS